MHTKKHLSFSAMRKALSELLAQIDDPRQAGKGDYALHDCLMSALAMMFFQDPSVLAFQRRMQQHLQDSNLKAMFAVENIPTDSALRQSLDEVPTPALHPAFSMLLGRLQRGRQLDAGMSFILVAKPSDHKVLLEGVNELDGLGQGAHLALTDANARRHVYRWVNQVPLNGSPHADPVNFFEYWLQVGEKVTYHNSWVADQTVSKDNVLELVRAGRARWKIENETFTI